MSARYVPGLAFREYRFLRRDLEADLPVVNASVLKNPTTIDMHGDFYPDEEEEEISEGKDSFVLGDALHKAVLEPHLDLSLPLKETSPYLLGPTKTLNSKAAVACRKMHPNKIVIDQEGKILTKAARMRDAILRDEHAKPWIAPTDDHGVLIPLHTELTGVAPDPSGEFVRKIRIDLCVGVDPEKDQMGDYLLDIKSCRSESLFPHKFQYQIKDYGYDIQAAYYLDTDSIIRTGTPDNPRSKFIIIAVESSHPYKVMVYELKQERIDAGRELYLDRMAMLAHAIRYNQWEGFQYQSPYPI